MKKLGFILLLACSLIALPCCNDNGGAAPEKKKKRKSKTEKVDSTKVVAQKKEKTHEGHAYVDLGLPSGTLWATCNVGAENPWEYGKYYAWGETYTKAEYDGDNCETDGKELGDISGNPAYDVARKEWGGQWRMPTKAESEELCNEEYCIWEWTTQNGVNGYKVMSKKNNNSIFLPAAGYRGGSSLNFVGEYGYFWSSTPDEERLYLAYRLGVDEDDRYVVWDGRDGGHSVRPVVAL